MMTDAEKQRSEYYVFVGLSVAMKIALVPYMIYEGWVLATIWNWFMPEVGFGTITVPVAMGVNLVFAVLLGPRDTKVSEAKPTFKEKVTQRFVTFFLSAWGATLALAVGWVIQRYFL